jgi:hypothetical protein
VSRGIELTSTRLRQVLNYLVLAFASSACRSETSDALHSTGSVPLPLPSAAPPPSQPSLKTPAPTQHAPSATTPPLAPEERERVDEFLRTAKALVEEARAGDNAHHICSDFRHRVKLPKDPWSTPIQLECPHLSFSIRLTSAGPDGAFDTADDVVHAQRLPHNRCF